jgi:hypothetical protein
MVEGRKESGEEKGRKTGGKESNEDSRRGSHEASQQVALLDADFTCPGVDDPLRGGEVGDATVQLSRTKGSSSWVRRDM